MVQYDVGNNLRGARMRRIRKLLREEKKATAHGLRATPRRATEEDLDLFAYVLAGQFAVNPRKKKRGTK